MGRHLGDGQPVTRRAVLASLDRAVPTPARVGSAGSPAIAAVLVVLAVILAACSDSNDSSNSDEEVVGLHRGVDDLHDRPATAPRRTRRPSRSAPRPRLAEYLKGQGYEYAGDCADAELPRDKGKWCSTLKSTDTGGRHRDLRRRPGGREAPEDGHGEASRRRRAHARLPGRRRRGERRRAPQLTREQLEADTFITGNLIADQQAGSAPDSATCRPARPAAARAAPVATEARVAAAAAAAARRRSPSPVAATPSTRRTAASWSRTRPSRWAARSRSRAPAASRTSRSRCSSTGT